MKARVLEKLIAFPIQFIHPGGCGSAAAAGVASVAAITTTQAFAWFSDLLVEHAEIFWSLFAVDMDRVLSEQPPDTWDSFPLFQILNDYLRTDDNLKNGRFHQHLRDTFAPLVVRYVDLMESSIAQSIHKGFEKERWESKG